jgi:hypothetical protein
MTEFVLDEIEHHGRTCNEVGRSEVDCPLRLTNGTRIVAPMSASSPSTDSIRTVLSIRHDQHAIDVLCARVESGIDAFLCSADIHLDLTADTELDDVATVRPSLEIVGHWLELSRDPLG